MKQLTAALIIEDKKLLVVHNIKSGLRIEPPGGKREEYETLKECVVREADEELGIRILPYELFGVYETQSPEGNFSVSMYLSTIKSGTPEIQSGEKKKHDRFEWCNYQQLQDYQQRNLLVPNLSKALNDLRINGLI